MALANQIPYLNIKYTTVFHIPPVERSVTTPNDMSQFTNHSLQTMQVLNIFNIHSVSLTCFFAASR